VEFRRVIQSRACKLLQSVVNMGLTLKRVPDQGE